MVLAGVAHSGQTEVTDLPGDRVEESGEGTLRSQLALSRMLEGLRSRWRTLAEWMYLRPLRICVEEWLMLVLVNMMFVTVAIMMVVVVNHHWWCLSDGGG